MSATARAGGDGVPAGRDATTGVRVRPRTGNPWRSAFLALVALGVVAGVGWALLGSTLLVVRAVVVTGTRQVSAAQVRAAADIPPGTPMTHVDTAAVAGRVDSLAQVASANVSRSWPDRIVIAVHERMPVLAVPATVSGARGFDLVDSSGAIVRWARVRPPGMPVYRTAGQPAALRGSPAVATAAAVLRELPRGLSRSVADVSAPSPQAVTLRLSDGVTIVWGGADHAAQKAREVAILLRAGTRYADVSAPGTAITR